MRSVLKKLRRAKQRAISLFAIACVAVALLYIAYRIALFVFPTNIATILLPVPSATITCDAHDENIEQRTTPIFSGQYQEYLSHQTALTPNLVRNSEMAAVDQNTDTPVGFARIAEGTDVTYQHLNDNDGKRFLRTITKADSKAEQSKGWIIDPVTIEPHQTYRFSFEYRSSHPVPLSMEFIKDGQHTYQPVTELPASKNWQQFTTHINNYQLAQALLFTVTLQKAGWLDVRDYAVQHIDSAQLPKAMVSITFDDGWQSIQNKAQPLLKKYQLRSTQYIISEASEKHLGGYMDIYALKELKSNGHEIGSHTLMHCDQTKQSEHDMALNAKESKQILERHALGPVTTFTYPYGQYNQATQQAFSEQYEFIRTSDFGYNDRYFDKQNIRSIPVNSATSDTELKSWLDHAVAHKLWLVLVYHRIDEKGAYSISSAQLERHLQLIKNSGLTVLPVSEAGRSIQP